MKEISVIIPCYNVEQYIDECVASLVNQTFGINRMELIFVNDASTDRTLEKLAAWEQQYPDSMIVVTLPQNSRQGAARNIGMQYATGTYLGFVDSDDYVDLTMYQKLYDVHQKDSVDCAICSRYDMSVDGTKKKLGPLEDGIMDLTAQKYANVLMNMRAPSGIFQRLYKREWLVALDVWFPENITYEDNFWGCIVNYYTKKVGMIQEPLYYYRINHTSTVQKRNASHHLDRLEIELMKLEELQNRGLFDYYRENIEFDFLNLYFVNSVFILLSKFDEIPDGLIKEMQQTTKTLFPRWRENPLLPLYEDVYEECQLIDYPFERGDRREVLLAYEYVRERRQQQNAKSIYSMEVEEIYTCIYEFIDKLKRYEEREKYIFTISNIYKSSKDCKKLVDELVEKMQGNMLQCIFYLSVLYEITEDVSIIYRIRECSKHEQIPCLKMENIRTAIGYEAFTKVGAKTDYVNERKLHHILIEKWQQEYGEIVPSIPKEKRIEKNILITTDQFLGIKHAPTKMVVHAIKNLIESGFQVYLLVNYTHFDAQELSELVVCPNIIHTNKDLAQKNILEIDSLRIPYLQVNYAQNTQQVISKVRAFVHKCSPQIIWHIGGTSFISDMVGRCSTMIATQCTDGYAISEAPILASYMASDSEYVKHAFAYIAKQEQKVESFLSPITNSYAKKNLGYTRDTYHLPEEKYLICLVGNRLNDEIDTTFLQWMEEIIEQSEQFLFVTIGNADEIWNNSKYKNKIIHLGYQSELTDVLTCMDIFVNPPRKGGGGGAVSAIAAGIPVLTLGNCDVAFEVPAEFIVKDLEEMKEKLLCCFYDSAFGLEMKTKAHEKMEELKGKYEEEKIKKAMFELIETATLYTLNDEK